MLGTKTVTSTSTHRSSEPGEDPYSNHASIQSAYQLYELISALWVLRLGRKRLSVYAPLYLLLASPESDRLGIRLLSKAFSNPVISEHNIRFGCRKHSY